jgi:DNA-binding CsgD family transcriptional regulator
MLQREFLSQIADKYGLPQEQKEVFLEKFGNDKSNQDIASTLNIAFKTVDYRLGKIYKKFGFGGKGSGKAHQLLSKLTTEYQKANASVSPSSNASETDAEPTQKKQDTNEIDALVQEVRSRIHDKILNDCGKMPLRNQQVTIDNLYTDVYILEDTPQQRVAEISQRLRDFDPTDDRFESFYLGKVGSERVPGLDVVRAC